MTPLNELAAMLDAATGPSREIDREISFISNWAGPYSPWSSSVDAALALVERLLPGWEWDIELNQGVFFCALLQIATAYADGTHCADAPTAPIAILKALVAALIAQETTNE
jgi:hypothetical protein